MDAVEAARKLIFELSTVKDSGEIREPWLETYAEHIGTDVDTAEAVIQLAMETLVDDGTVLEVYGTYYVREAYEEHERAECEAMEDYRQEMCDEMQSYDFNIWHS